MTEFIHITLCALIMVLFLKKVILSCIINLMHKLENKDILQK